MPTIRGELRRHFRDAGWMIRVPRRAQDLQAHIRRAQPDLEAQLGRSPRPTEGAAHLDADVDDVIEAFSAAGCFRPSSIDSPTGTQQEIADLVGLTQVQVSRILTRVLTRLRADLTEPLPAA